MTTYKNQNSIYEILEIVKEFKIFDINRISKIIDFGLYKNKDYSNNAFIFYEGKCNLSDCKFIAAELRESINKSKSKNGLLKLTLNTMKYNISQAQLIDELGDPEISPPDPRQIANPLLYLIYNINDKRYSFGFPVGNDTKGELVVIIIKPN